MNIEQTRKLARDETTLPEVLANLSRNEDYRIRQSVAANPNTPAKTLFCICREFPNEVINNPVVPLLLLENPCFFSCKVELSFEQVKYLIDIEMKRLGWTTEQGRNYLIQNYGKRSRYYLKDEELLDFLYRLQSM